MTGEPEHRCGRTNKHGTACGHAVHAAGAPCPDHAHDAIVIEPDRRFVCVSWPTGGGV